MTKTIETKGITMDEIQAKKVMNVPDRKNISVIQELLAEIQDSKIDTKEMLGVLSDYGPRDFVGLLKKFNVDMNRVKFEYGKILYKMDERKDKYRKLSITDFLSKVCQMRSLEAIQVAYSYITNIDKMISICGTEERAEIREVSTPKKPVYYGINGWNQASIPLENLESYLRQCSSINVANFRDGKRANENIESLNPLLILDIDNNGGEKISIAEIKKNFPNEAYIYTSASHLKDGITEKFRMIIPTTEAFRIHDFEDNWKTYYAKYVDQTLEQYFTQEQMKAFDNVRTKPSQQYFGMTEKSKFYQIKGERLDTTQTMLTLKNEYKKDIERELKTDKRAIFESAKSSFEKSASTLRNIPQDNPYALTRMYLENFLNLPILQVIQVFEEDLTLRSEGQWQIAHTFLLERNAYIPSENSIYSFKDNKYVNPYIYLKERMEEFQSDIANKVKEPRWLDVFSKISEARKEDVQKPQNEQRRVLNYNNYSMFSYKYFSEYYSQICRLNYKGIAENMMKFMSNIFDENGVEMLKIHYQIKQVEFEENYLNIGYLKEVKYSDLISAKPEFENWLYGEQPERKVKGVENEFGI